MKNKLLFTKLTELESDLAAKAWKIYEEAFSSDTRRGLKEQLKVLENQDYNFCLVRQDALLIGLIAYWGFGEFVFIEHLAVDKALRNKGLGSLVLQEFIGSRDGQLVILEVHRPVEEIDKRRVGFYERNGFKLNEFDYLQPAYEVGKKAVPLFIMSAPRVIDEIEFDKTRKVLHTKVYGLSEVLIG